MLYDRSTRCSHLSCIVTDTTPNQTFALDAHEWFYHVARWALIGGFWDFSRYYPFCRALEIPLFRNRRGFGVLFSLYANLRPRTFYFLPCISTRSGICHTSLCFYADTTLGAFFHPIPPTFPYHKRTLGGASSTIRPNPCPYFDDAKPCRWHPIRFCSVGYLCTQHSTFEPKSSDAIGWRT